MTTRLGGFAKHGVGRRLAACIAALALGAGNVAGAWDGAKPTAATAADTNGATPAYELPGGIARDSTLASLQKQFGTENAVAGDLDGAEGEVLRGIVLFPNDAQRRADLFMRDEVTLEGVMTIRVRGQDSRWRTDDGLRLGMTLNELVALNGAPIGYSGLGWDYGGAVLDWKQGRLAPRDGATVFRGVSLASGDDAPEGAVPQGDGEFASDDEVYPQAGRLLRVDELQVSFLDEALGEETADPDASETE